MPSGGKRAGAGRPFKLDKKIRRQFILSPGLLDKLREASDRTHRSQSAIVESAIAEYLNKPTMNLNKQTK